MRYHFMSLRRNYIWLDTDADRRASDASPTEDASLHCETEEANRIQNASMSEVIRNRESVRQGNG